MPQHESDLNPATEPESGALDGIGPVLPSCIDTQAESQLATEGDAGAGTDGRILPITEKRGLRRRN